MVEAEEVDLLAQLGQKGARGLHAGGLDLSADVDGDDGRDQPQDEDDHEHLDERESIFHRRHGKFNAEGVEGLGPY